MTQGRTQVFKVLRGNSGCRVELIRHGETQIVRKIAASTDYNFRLRSQMEIQNRAEGFPFDTPEVFRDGYLHDGRFYFDMEYVSGISLQQGLEVANVKQISSYAERVAEILKFFSETPPTSGPQAFNSKLQNLKTNLELPTHQRARVLIDSLTNVAELTPPPSMCHGDLSLENILVAQGRFFLIDFQDIFYQSWIQDLAKMIFDIDIGWSARSINSPANRNLGAVVKNNAFRDRLEAAARSTISSTGASWSLIPYIEIVHGLRMLPYVTDSEWKKRIEDKCEELMRAVQERH